MDHRPIPGLWSIAPTRGARLLVDDPDCVPDEFTLVQKGTVATLWKCRVVWRSGSHVGVKFEGRAIRAVNLKFHQFAANSFRNFKFKTALE